MFHPVLILGGGSGGTILANRLVREGVDVTMISASREHLFQPGLLYVAFANAKANIVRDQRSVLSERVRFLGDTVTAVDLQARTVTTRSGGHHEYGTLVIATGVVTDPSGIPGLADVNAAVGDYHSSVASAKRLWSRLDAFKGGTIALGQASPICKCPPSPIEGILLVDRLLRARGIRDKSRLVFFTPSPRPYPAAPINEIVEPLLKEREIEVRTFFDLDRIDAETRRLTSIEGEEIECDLPIVIPPFVGADIAYNPPDVLDAERLVATNRETLRVKDTEDVFAIGDATNIPTSKAGVGAHLEARVVAEVLTGHPAVFDGRTNCPFDLGDGTGTFVSGTYDAPARPLRPTRLRHLMKMAFSRIYWLSLSGRLEPMFDTYFKVTAPKEPERPADESRTRAA